MLINEKSIWNGNRPTITNRVIAAYFKRPENYCFFPCSRKCLRGQSKVKVKGKGTVFPSTGLGGP
jgi:hypothetical protein